jgi:uncharacterized protein YdeI (BOF family)
MKRSKLTGLLILIALMALAMQAVQAKDEPVELKNEPVEIQDIIEDASAYEGKMVVIEGKIETECPSGCWFIVDDGSASIYVDILPSNFVIPQKRGSEIRVYGEVTTQDGDPMMIGKIVEIDGAIYR